MSAPNMLTDEEIDALQSAVTDSRTLIEDYCGGASAEDRAYLALAEGAVEKLTAMREPTP